MAFEMGFGEVVVEKGVVFQFGERVFRIEIERLLENAEGFLLVEHPHGQEVADLQDEAATFCSSVA
jgi:hypothetical protein